MLNAVYYAALANFARLYVVAIIGRLNGWTRYDRNTYLEVDISEIPPGEVLQIVWNGTPVFIRRLTAQEVQQENELP
jgi:ubiquinol-cytochrome c reductase iron-sulfur subunit